MKIDYVLPWVNPNDKFWQQQHALYSDSKQVLEGVNSARFRDNCTLKYVLRSIEVFAPWINNVYLILSSDSQVEPWMNTKNLKIVYHDQYIPKEYLPTFNSTTIEAYLCRIPGLEEHFIYGNDDTFIAKPCQPKDFFNQKTGHVKEFYRVKNKVSGPFELSIKKSFDSVRKDGNGIILPEDSYVKPSHLPHPFLKSQFDDCLFNKKLVLKNSITQFRNNYKNVSQAMFTDYLIVKGLVDLVEENGFYCNLSSVNDWNSLVKYFDKGTKPLLCINDAEDASDPELLKELPRLLEFYFSKKSKYEN